MMRSKIITAAVAALLLSTVAAVADMNDMKGMTGMSGTGRCTHYRTMGSETGVHNMSGRVTRLNHRTGMVSVKTEEGILRLHFPPTSLKHVKRGDKLQVNLGFSVSH